MSMSMKIKQILVKRSMSIKELSGIMGCKTSYLYNRITRDKFSEQDLINIAKALNCDYEGVFTLKDTGEKI